MKGTNEQVAGSRRAARAGSAVVLAVALLFPGRGWTMAADGALITNIVTATYHSMAGFPGPGVTPFAPQYRMSYLATATILISCPIVSITKRANTSVQAVAGTVTFEICAINTSLAASAWNLVITDKLMDNMSYLQPRAFWAPAGTTVTPSSSTDNAVWTGVEPANGTINPLWLRWTISPLGPMRSACITFQAVVN